MGRVEGKVVFVTGGASGLGAADVKLMAQHGAKVVIADVNNQLGEQVAAETPGSIFIQLDVRDEDAWKSAIAKTVSHFGRLDCLVNNAGIVKFASVEQCTLEEYRLVNAVMSEGTFLGCKTAIPAMTANDGGSIINMGSIAGIKGIGAIPAYSAAKGAILALTRNVAAHCRELGNGVRCNAVIPGSILTPMTLQALQEMSPDSASFEELEGHGQGQPIDVANFVLYLASDESRHVNGTSLVIDNGETA